MPCHYMNLLTAVFVFLSFPIDWQTTIRYSELHVGNTATRLYMWFPLSHEDHASELPALSRRYLLSTPVVAAGPLGRAF